MKRSGRLVLVFVSFLALAAVLEAEELVVESDQGEILYPLWIEKGQKIRFQINGSWSMWHPEWEHVDWRGHTGFKRVNGNYLGTLMGAIEGGESFPVENGMMYESPLSGRLILFPNRGNYAHLQTHGSMKVTAEGGRRVTETEAEKLLGWDIPLLDTARAAGYMSDGEKDVVLYLNKSRHDPPLFAELYLKPRIKESAAASECYRELKSTKPMPLLEPSRPLYKAARDHAVDLGRAGMTGHVGTDGSDLSERIERYGQWMGSISENCSYGFQDPLSIVLQLLIDDGVPSRGHRKNILNPESILVGTAIQPHTRYRFNCVQDFASSIREK
jgi:hypothetical protein